MIQDAQRRELEHRLSEAQRNTEIYRSQLEQAEKKAENYRDKLEEEVKERRKMEQLFQASRQLQLVAAYRQALNQQLASGSEQLQPAVTTATSVSGTTPHFLPEDSANTSPLNSSTTTVTPLPKQDTSIPTETLTAATTLPLNIDSPVSTGTADQISTDNIAEAVADVQPAVITETLDFTEGIPDQNDFSSIGDEMLVTPTDLSLPQLHLPEELPIERDEKPKVS